MKLVDEAGRAAGKDHVAGQCQAGACAGGNAVHGGEHRHVEAAQGQHEGLVVAVDGRGEIQRAVGDGAGALAQVLPGAKAAAGAGKDQCTQATVAPHDLQGRAQVGVHCRGETVQAFGPVQGQRGDAFAAFEQDGIEAVFETHGGTRGTQLGS